MRLRQAYFRFFILLTLLACSEKKNIIPGTSLELAVERKSTISYLQYDLFFDIPVAQKDSIPARVTLKFNLKNTSSILQLDFNAPTEHIQNIKVNDRTAAIHHENEHILIDQSLLKDGSNSISIEFIAGEAALNRNADYLYTLFVPSRASTCFPAFDQPDLKALYRLELNIPKGWQAVSNGKVISIDTLENKKHYIFGETRPTSTYQFAFAVGHFRVASDPKSGMTMYYRETDSVKVARNIPKIFELHWQSLAWLKEFTKIDYPYNKFDFALMPAFQFGGMEHPGSIFYRESSLFLEPSSSVNEELRRASLIAHETAHMWFGNLVTMKWFNDVWLKEVFANFMAAKMASPAFPQINHELRFLMAHYPAAYDIDRSDGSHPIQQPLDNLKNAGSVYGAIIYQKAPIMMRNLETLIGEKKFQFGLQEYLATFSYQNATWDDLVNVLKKYTDQDLEVWNNAWIKSTGMPEIALAPMVDSHTAEVQVVNDSQGIIWPQSFKYKIISPGKESIQDIMIRKNQRALLDISNIDDKAIIPNYKGKGYGYFHGSADYMFRVVDSLDDEEARAGIWMNIWEYMVRGELEPAITLQRLLSAIGREPDPLLMEYLTDKIARIFWQFLTPAERSLVSVQVDDTLFERMALEQDNSLKRTLFNCYWTVAISPDGIINLKKFWNDEITLGLELSERDHIQLAYALAVRGAGGHEEILKDQLKKILNPDKKAEMEFILPALSFDVGVRDKFNESLKNKENRVREPWVLEALRYLHHPLRTGSSTKYIGSSLALLEEIQRTGDIFFPKGWLDATLGDYQSEEAATLVRDYLKWNAKLRPDLRNKLLQSADMLFRAERAVRGSRVPVEDVP